MTTSQLATIAVSDVLHIESYIIEERDLLVVIERPLRVCEKAAEVHSRLANQYSEAGSQRCKESIFGRNSGDRSRPIFSAYLRVLPTLHVCRLCGLVQSLST